MQLFRIFCPGAIGSVAVGHGASVGRVVLDARGVASGSEVHVAARPRVVEAVDLASVVLEEIADGIVGIVLGFANSNRALHGAGAQCRNHGQQGKKLEKFLHGKNTLRVFEHKYSVFCLIIDNFYRWIDKSNEKNYGYSELNS